eukprot:gene15451-biopygen10095
MAGGCRAFPPPTIKVEPQQKLMSLVAVNRHGFIAAAVQSNGANVSAWLAKHVEAFEASTSTRHRKSSACPIPDTSELSRGFPDSS